MVLFKVPMYSRSHSISCYCSHMTCLPTCGQDTTPRLSQLKQPTYRMWLHRGVFIRQWDGVAHHQLTHGDMWNFHLHDIGLKPEDPELITPVCNSMSSDGNRRCRMRRTLLS